MPDDSWIRSWVERICSSLRMLNWRGQGEGWKVRTAPPTNDHEPHPLPHPLCDTHRLRQCDLSILKHVVDVSVDLLPGDQQALVAGVQCQLGHEVALDKLSDVLSYLINGGVT